MTKLIQTLKDYKVDAVPSEDLDFIGMKPNNITYSKILTVYDNIKNGYSDGGNDIIMKESLTSSMLFKNFMKLNFTLVVNIIYYWNPLNFHSYYLISIKSITIL